MAKEITVNFKIPEAGDVLPFTVLTNNEFEIRYDDDVIETKVVVA